MSQHQSPDYGQTPQFPQQGQQYQPYQQQQYQQQYTPSQEYAPPRRSRGPWIAAGAIVLAAVAGGAYIVLHGSSPAAPLTCAQQYQNWKAGPARAPGKQLEADAAALSSAGQDIKIVSGKLQAIGADAAALEAYPMPACADPAGYWAQYLTAIRAAGDNAGTASGLGGLILAEAPLKQVPGIQAKLTAELAKTAGVKAS